jgi:hypothetical protein
VEQTIMVRRLLHDLGVVIYFADEDMVSSDEPIAVRGNMVRVRVGHHRGGIREPTR